MLVLLSASLEVNLLTVHAFFRDINANKATLLFYYVARYNQTFFVVVAVYDFDFIFLSCWSHKRLKRAYWQKLKKNFSCMNVRYAGKKFHSKQPFVISTWNIYVLGKQTYIFHVDIIVHKSIKLMKFIWNIMLNKKLSNN